MRTILALAFIFGGVVSCAQAAVPQLALLAQQGTVDTDGDGVFDIFDNAPGTSNTNQADADGDLIADIIDPTPSGSNPNLGDPGLGIYGPLPILPGQNAVFDYQLQTTPPGGWGRLLLDFDADFSTDAVYLGPLTTSINAFSIPANLFVDPLWDLYTPGTYTVGMKAFAPGMSSQNWAFPNITVLPVPEPGTLALVAVVGIASLVGCRRRAYR